MSGHRAEQRRQVAVLGGEGVLQIAQQARIAPGGGAGHRVGEVLARHAVGDRAVVRQVVDQRVGVGEIDAVQPPAGIDRQAVVLGLVSTEGVEVLEGEPDRVDHVVAGAADLALGGAVVVLAIRRRSHARHAGGDGHVGAGRRAAQLDAHELLQDEQAAQHRRRVVGVRVRRQELGLHQEAATPLGQIDLGPHVRDGRREPVDRRGVARHEHPCRRQQVAHRAAAREDDLGQEPPRLLGEVVPDRARPRAAGAVLADAIEPRQIEPLRGEDQEAVGGARIGQHAIDLRRHVGDRGEPPPGRGVEQRRVGHRRPQQVRQP